MLAIKFDFCLLAHNTYQSTKCDRRYSSLLVFFFYLFGLPYLSMITFSSFFFNLRPSTTKTAYFRLSRACDYYNIAIKTKLTKIWMQCLMVNTKSSMDSICHSVCYVLIDHVEHRFSTVCLFVSRSFHLMLAIKTSSSSAMSIKLHQTKCS